MQNSKTTGGGIQLAAFVVAMAVSTTIIVIGERYGFEQVDTVVKALVALSLVYLMPDKSKMGWGRRAGMVMAFSVLSLCGAWVAYLWFRGGVGEGLDWRTYLIPAFLNIVIVTPIFEEKMVRHLLFGWAKSLVGAVTAAIIVSVAFSVAHLNVFAWSFAFSIMLCWISHRFGASSIQCAIVHGSVNAFVLFTYLL